MAAGKENVMDTGRKYTHTSGKQQVVISAKKPGNMYKWMLGGTKRKRRVVKR